MNCPKCGTILQPNVKFCKKCGTNVESLCRYGDNIKNSVYDSSSCHKDQYNYSYNYSNKTEPKYNINASHADQFDYTYLYSKYNYNPTQNSSDEKYLESYVGPNYNSIKNSKFSFGALIFGGYYFLYRKYWSYAFLFFFITIASTLLLGEIADIVNLIIRIFMATKFNEAYLSKVEQKVEQIKQSNFDKTSNELLDECRKKGGVSLSAAIITPIIVVVIAAIIFSYLTLTGNTDYLSESLTEETEKISNENTNITDTNNFISLTYKLPEDVKLLSATYNYRFYQYNDPSINTTCNIRISTEDNTQTSYQLLTNKISKTIGMTINPINQMTKHTYLWDYVHLESSTKSQTFYATTYDNNLYLIETYDYNPTITKCNEIYAELLNSLTFKQ